MTYQNLVNRKLLKKEKIGFDQIEKLIKRALVDIKSAKVLLKVDEDGAYNFAYQAMLHAGRALVFSQGFRPSAYQAHKTVVECVRKTLGKEYKYLVIKFDKMRKKRHELIYEVSISISSIEAKSAIKSASDLIEKIKKEIQSKNPQKKLF